MSSNESRSGLSQNPEIAESLKIHSIKNIARVYNEYTLARVSAKSELKDQKKIFDFLPGALLFYLDNGDVVGFSGDGVKDSVVVWFDVRDGLEDFTTYYDREWALYMNYDDPIYSDKNRWIHMIGKKITKLEVMKVSRGEKQYFDDFCERAIVISTESGDMVISYCLLDLPSGASFPVNYKIDIPKDIFSVAEIFEV